MADGARGRVVADIDLEAGRRTRSHHNQETGRNSPGGDSGSGHALVAASPGPVRGLSWGQSIHFSGAAPVAREGSTMPGMEPEGQLLGGAVGVGVAGGGRACGEDGDREGGESICHIAVACGSEVRLWKVSRVSCDTGAAGVAASVGGGGKPAMRFRYSALSVVTDWHRTTHENDGIDGSKEPPFLRGNIRCLSFRPCGGAGSADASAVAGVVGREGAVPLAAWCDRGAVVLG